MEIKFQDEIIKFIAQAKTTNLKTLENYKNKYLEFKVRVSFGKGTPARVPWLALLKKGAKIK